MPIVWLQPKCVASCPKFSEPVWVGGSQTVDGMQGHAFCPSDGITEIELAE